MGSLIKNLGGSIAPAGAYVAGRAELVERVRGSPLRARVRSGAWPDVRLRRGVYARSLFSHRSSSSKPCAALDFIAALFEALG